ncbi:hypothetical protein ACIG5E_38200 [Kitasatospora sp. NPDC053057]|uniref:hypothetical protein n=1 Tax=Kitasatospora sp. NPDC053057 TaxID=3364062 RepID=UPI0037C840CE
MGGDAEDVDAPGLDLHDEEDVEALEEDGVHVQEVAGEKRVGLCADEGAPGLPGGALWCGRQTEAAQDAADGGGGDAVAEPSQLALDPDVAPGRILCGEAPDERDDLFG